MEWPIARGINGDEKVEIQILAHNRSTFIKDFFLMDTSTKGQIDETYCPYEERMKIHAESHIHADLLVAETINEINKYKLSCRF